MPRARFVIKETSLAEMQLASYTDKAFAELAGLTYIQIRRHWNKNKKKNPGCTRLEFRRETIRRNRDNCRLPNEFIAALLDS